MICAKSGPVESARESFVSSYGGFTRVLTEPLHADSFRMDGCEILAVLSFGFGETPWVSLSIVPDERHDPRLDLLSYEFLTEAERREIEPNTHPEISPSGLA